MAAESATFYFDYNSPYAYLAAQRIDELIPDAEWKPIAVGVLFGKIGKVPWSVQEGRETRMAEVEQRAADRGLPPVTWPAGWPVETWSFAPLRAALFAGDHGRLKEFSAAAFRKHFVENVSLAELDNVLAAAREAGLDPDEVEGAIQRPENKERLKEHTDEALANGVTGVPTIALGDQLFWGDDRLEEAAAAR